MKRISVIFLLVCLLCSAVSCIQMKPIGAAPESTPGATDAPEPTQPNIPDAPALPAIAWTDAETTARLFQSFSGGVVNTSRREYSYGEMVQDLGELARLYPEHFSYRSFGKSVLGRDLYVATLGNSEAPRRILVSAGIHGREYLTPLLAMKQLEFYLAYYDEGSYAGVSYAELFDKVCFFVVPMTNPDGIMMSQAGISTVSDPVVSQAIANVYQKDLVSGYTQQTQLDEYLKIWKANANGVDLNRNYDALWSDYDGIRRPSHKNYKGATAASEPETRAMVELTESLGALSAVICIHSQGEVLYWNCGQESELAIRTRAFTRAISELNGYRVVLEQNNDASFSDWCALKKGLIAVTVETGVDNCPLPISQFPTIWEQNFHLLAHSAAYFTQPKG